MARRLKQPNPAQMWAGGSPVNPGADVRGGRPVFPSEPPMAVGTVVPAASTTAGVPLEYPSRTPRIPSRIPRVPIMECPWITVGVPLECPLRIRVPMEYPWSALAFLGSLTVPLLYLSTLCQVGTVLSGNSANWERR